MQEGLGRPRTHTSVPPSEREGAGEEGRKAPATQTHAAWMAAAECREQRVPPPPPPPPLLTAMHDSLIVGSRVHIGDAGWRACPHACAPPTGPHQVSRRAHPTQLLTACAPPLLRRQHQHQRKRKASHRMLRCQAECGSRVGSKVYWAARPYRYLCHEVEFACTGIEVSATCVYGILYAGTRHHTALSLPNRRKS